MASLCAVITKPFGNIPDIYGESNFLIQPQIFVQETIKLLQGISFDTLANEENEFTSEIHAELQNRRCGEKFTDALRD
jgi:hypothetical protein